MQKNKRKATIKFQGSQQKASTVFVDLSVIDIKYFFHLVSNEGEKLGYLRRKRLVLMSVTDFPLKYIPK